MRNPFDPFGYLLEDQLPSTGFGVDEETVDFTSVEQDMLAALRKIPGSAPEMKSEPSDDEKVFSLDGAAFDFPDDAKVDLTLTTGYRDSSNEVTFDLEGPDGSGEACRNALVDILMSAGISVDTGAIKIKTNGASVAVLGKRDKEAEAFGERL